MYNVAYLRALLKGLPPILPWVSASESTYKFHDFGVCEEDVEDIGLVGAVNRQLEVRLGSRTKRGDTFELTERGPGIEALAEVLSRYADEIPGDLLLEKWIQDACRAAEIVYKDARKKLPGSSTPELGFEESDGEFVASTPRANTGSDSEEIEELEPPKEKKGKKKPSSKKAKGKRPSTKVLTDFEDDRYSDTEEEEDRRAGGAKVEPLLLKVSRPCFKRSADGSSREGGKRVRCIASRQCNKSWTWPRHQQRVLSHTASCNGVPHPDRDRARELMAAKASHSGGSKASSRRKRRRSVSSSSDSDDADQRKPSAQTAQQAPKRARASSPSASEHKRTSPNPLEAFSKQGIQDLKENGDDALVVLLVGAGIAPSVVDSEWFKNFVSTIQPKYRPPSSTTLRDRLIPNEAAKCHVELISDLREIRNLTLSFDGGKLRRPRGIYTVTITTPTNRKSYIVELNDASYVSHTAGYISGEVIEPVLEKVQSENVAAVVSDNTGNTRKARELISAKFPHILNLQDCCHEMNLSLLQINDLDEFKETIQNVREILSFMHHSTYAMEHYNAAREDLKIKTGLSHIGITRFWTYVAAAESVYRGLPAFRKIVSQRELGINIASKNELFDSEMHPVTTSMFEISLVQYLAVTTPFARAIKCLEATTTTASDVYAFWLSIMSNLEYLMTSGSSRTKLSKHTMEDIRAIANQRFNELIEDGQEDIYISAFFLDPRYRNAPVLKTGNINPLAIPSVSIQRDESGAPSVAPSSTDSRRELLIARVGIWLQDLLLREYGGEEMVDRKDILTLMETRNPLLKSYPPEDAFNKLRDELKAYAKSRDPFNRRIRPGQTVLQWWKKVQKDEEAHILGALAIKIFSAVPHSMADERFMSVITWLNGPRRSCQQVKTVHDHLTIRQHYMNKDPRFATAAPRPTKQAPVVRRWCDLQPDVREGTAMQAPPDAQEGEDSDDLEHQERAQRQAVESLCMGANMGDLGQERRSSFVAGDSFDLSAQFFREMLSDNVEMPSDGRAGSNSTHGNSQPSKGAAAAGVAPATGGRRPSQLDWKKWA